jgi:hypothetical protein
LECMVADIVAVVVDLSEQTYGSATRDCSK